MTNSPTVVIAHPSGPPRVQRIHWDVAPREEAAPERDSLRNGKIAHHFRRPMFNAISLSINRNEIPQQEKAARTTSCQHKKLLYHIGTGALMQFRKNASVAQLDRAPVFGTGGWGFESLRVYSCFAVVLRFFQSPVWSLLYPPCTHWTKTTHQSFQQPLPESQVTNGCMCSMSM